VPGDSDGDDRSGLRIVDWGADHGDRREDRRTARCLRSTRGRAVAGPGGGSAMTSAVERVVVALDAASENRAAIGAAARLAARWKARLHGVFVEDDDLIRLAHLPF